MQKHILLLGLKAVLLVMLVNNRVAAQQQSLYTQYNQNNYLLNPALGGHNFGGDLRLGGRQQFNSNIQNPALNYVLTAHFSMREREEPKTNGMPIRGKLGDKLLDIRRAALKRDKGYKTHSGLGATVVYDRFASLSFLTAQATYAFHYAVNTNTQLSVGLGGGGTQYSLNTSGLELEDMTDAVLLNNQTVFVPTASAGVWLAGKNYYVGLAGQQLVPNNYSFIANAVSVEKSQDQIHGYLTAGYKILALQDLAIVPSTMVRMVAGGGMAADLSLTLNLKDAVWFGATFRGGKATSAAFMGGCMLFDRLMVGYSYDHNLNNQFKQSVGVHEVVLGLRLEDPKSKQYAPNDLWK